MNLRQQLEEAEDQVDRLRRQIAAADCREAGCQMVFIGGRNAGCSKDCVCSVPVHQCSKCKDCDYGDNAEASEIIRKCREEDQ